MDVAGLALGAISLGLEVCKGLYQFVDGVKGQAHDLEVLGRHARTLEANLTATRDAITRLQQSPNAGTLHPGTAGSIVAVSSSVISCQADLRTLQELLVKYAGGCGIANSGFRERCRQTFRTLEYGFHGGKRDEMESLLAAVNGNLVVGMEALGLNIAIDASENAATTESRIIAKLDTQGRDESKFRADAGQHLDFLTNQTALIRMEVQSTETNLSKRLDRGQLVSDLTQTSVTTIETSVLPAMQAEARQFSTSTLKQLGEITNQLTLATAPRDEISSSTLMAISQGVGLNQATLADVSVALNQLLVAQQYPSKPSVNTQVTGHPGPDLADITVHQKQVRSASSTSTGLSPICSCRPYSSSRKLWTAQFGVSQVTATRTETATHRLGCAYYASAVDRRTRRRDINSRVKLFGVVVNFALNLSGGWTSGAGAPISPMLRYSTIVDMDVAPAFRLMNTLRQAVQAAPFTCSYSQYERILGHGVRKLRQLYSTHRFSGTDVTLYGKTLAHDLFEVMLQCCYKSGTSTEEMLSLVGPLWLECTAVIGVSLTQEAFNGQLPYMYFISHGHSKLPLPLLQSLLPGELRGSLRLHQHYRPSFRVPASIGSEWMLAEVFDLEPLGEAILRNHGLIAERLVAADPALCLQSAIFGMNHFELSISAGLCLPNLVAGLKASEHGRHLLRNLLGSPARQYYPTWALSQCRTRAADLPGASTHRCPQATAISVLTAEDDCVIWPQLGDLYIDQPCADCVDAYCRALYYRRERLKDFAAARLSPASIAEFGLDKDIPLDRHAAAVVARLAAFGIDVPLGLSLGFDDEQTSPIFHGPLGSLVLADALFAIGFRDVDAPNTRGHTPLQVGAVDALARGTQQSKCLWLIEQGADQSKPFMATAPPSPFFVHSHHNKCIRKILNADTTPAITVTHALAAAIGEHKLLRNAPTFSKYMPLEPWLRDNSDCLCGPGLGWDPFLYFAAVHLDIQPSDEMDATYIIASKAKELHKTCEEWLPVTRYKDVFRYITFEALSLEHTTCILASADSDSDSDDISEDESEGFTLLESIVSELDTIIDVWSAAAICSPHSRNPPNPRIVKQTTPAPKRSCCRPGAYGWTHGNAGPRKPLHDYIPKLRV